MTRYPSKKTVEAKLAKALNKLMKNDMYLIDNNANERSISHKLAEYIQQEFPEWNVDCEYNRIDNHLPKALISLKDDKINIDNKNAPSVFPDIIIHHRGTEDNFVVIEMKKFDVTPKKILSDKKKLAGYMEELNYHFGYFIYFKNNPLLYVLQEFRDGKLHNVK